MASPRHGGSKAAQQHQSVARFAPLSATDDADGEPPDGTGPSTDANAATAGAAGVSGIRIEPTETDATAKLAPAHSDEPALPVAAAHAANRSNGKSNGKSNGHTKRHKSKAKPTDDAGAAAGESGVADGKAAAAADVPAWHEGGKPCPEASSNFFARITYWWVGPLLRLGYATPLRGEHLWQLPPAMTTAAVDRALQANWLHWSARALDPDTGKPMRIAGAAAADHGQSNSGSSGSDSANADKGEAGGRTRYPLLRALVDTFKRAYLVPMFWYRIALIVTTFVRPALLQRVLWNIQNTGDGNGDGSGTLGAAFGFVLLLVLNALIQASATHMFYWWGVKCALSVRTACIQMVYRKALRLNTTERRRYTAGSIVNMASVDADNLMSFAWASIYELWASPLVIALTLLYLVAYLGWAAWVGVGVMVASLAVSAALSRWMGAVQERSMRAADARLRLINEMLGAVKLIKLYAWEAKFRAQIASARATQFNYIAQINAIGVCNRILGAVVPSFVSLGTFGVFVEYGGGTLDASTAFTSLLLFYTLREPLGKLPESVGLAVRCWISQSRVTAFLMAAEKPNYVLPNPDVPSKRAAKLLQQQQLQEQQTVAPATATEHKRSGSAQLPTTVVDEHGEVTLTVAPATMHSAVVNGSSGNAAAAPAPTPAVAMRRDLGVVIADGSFDWQPVDEAEAAAAAAAAAVAVGHADTDTLLGSGGSGGGSIDGFDDASGAAERTRHAKRGDNTASSDEHGLQLTPLPRNNGNGNGHGNNASAGAMADVSLTVRADGGASAAASVVPVPSEPVLCDINLRIRGGDLVIVVGPVGSGKSSLLQCLLGEMRVVKGRVSCPRLPDALKRVLADHRIRTAAAASASAAVSASDLPVTREHPGVQLTGQPDTRRVLGNVSYTSQLSWMLNDTIRGNIVFGKAYDKARYANTIRVCALERDLSILPFGDATEIGENGINLSGGQKQRISLARAVYADADLYLLDEPLSAVDAHVGKWLFEKCISNTGVLRGKTRVLVTHQLQFLRGADQIVVMNRGRIEHVGSYDSLTASGVDFSSIVDSNRALIRAAAAGNAPSDGGAAAAANSNTVAPASSTPSAAAASAASADVKSPVSESGSDASSSAAAPSRGGSMDLTLPEGMSPVRPVVLDSPMSGDSNGGFGHGSGSGSGSSGGVSPANNPSRHHVARPVRASRSVPNALGAIDEATAATNDDEGMGVSADEKATAAAASVESDGDEDDEHSLAAKLTRAATAKTSKSSPAKQHKPKTTKQGRTTYASVAMAEEHGDGGDDDDGDAEALGGMQLSDDDGDGSSGSDGNDKKIAKSKSKKKPKLTNLIVSQETTDTGFATNAVYKQYMLAAGGWALLAVASFFVVTSQATFILSDLYLAYWTGHSGATTALASNSNSTSTTTPTYPATQYGGTPPPASYYVNWYVALTFVALVLFAVRMYLILYGTQRAATTLHDRIVHGLLRAPMAFFDTTPSGRIINRCGKDQDICDAQLPNVVQDIFSCSVAVIGTLALICYIAWYAVFPMALITAFYWYIQKYYRPSSRELKRLEAISRSHVYAHFTESIHGLCTIRAYNDTARFERLCAAKIDRNCTFYFHAFATNRWLGWRLEMVGCLTLLTAAGLSLALSATLGPALVGLSITSTLALSGNLNWMVRQISELEVLMNAVERVIQYGNTPPEAPDVVDDCVAPPAWPHAGTVQFDRLELCYRPGLPPVLRGVECTIHAGEKIGIVGRTGAGKSTFSLAMFRLIEPSGGTIRIDGLDITRLGLHQLRSRMSIIPQDPVLFAGSLRQNIDPFDTLSDADLWSVLDRIQLSDTVRRLKGQLDFVVDENGDNFSLGERQLLCLARAMARRSKIVIMDEASASLDFETDQLIRAFVEREFRDCTVITIAHRLHTVMHSTRIMVLDKGEVVEFDTPARLAATPGGFFRKLLHDAQAHGDDFGNANAQARADAANDGSGPNSPAAASATAPAAGVPAQPALPAAAAGSAAAAAATTGANGTNANGSGGGVRMHREASYY